VYPVAFQNDRREIFVEGEVFLHVAADAQRPFFVKTHQVDVQATGTEFNVKAHRDEDESTVVLVSGIVTVFSKNREHTLKPNDIYTYNNGQETVENGAIYIYVSWKDGLYIFDSERLDVIAKHLSRYYGVEIKCSDAAADMRCTGKLDMKEKFETVLEGMSYAVPIVCSYRNGGVYVSPK
jgi:ferric-dicitrate binding protein FerR (iron transport regulator)